MLPRLSPATRPWRARVWLRSIQQRAGQKTARVSKKATAEDGQEISGSELPPHAQWRKVFSTNRIMQRVSVSNQETADKIADAFIPTGSRGKVIVEAFPGPGALTRGLMKLPKNRIEKIIILEDHEPYLEYLQPLEQIDDRIKVVALSGYNWSTYSEIEDMGLLDVVGHPWEEVHPKLHFISHLPSNVYGEQLISQFLRLIPDRHWFFRYGRIPMSFVMSEYVWQRIFPPTKAMQCKLSVIGQAVAHWKMAVPQKYTNPFEDHFHPIPMKYPGRGQARSQSQRLTRQIGHPYMAVNTIPTVNQIIEPNMLQKWDYCIRRLFVQKATKLSGVLSLLGPGAQVLADTLNDPAKPPEEILDLSKPPRDLTVDEWALIVKAFHEWPFAPDDLDIDSGVVNPSNAMR